MTPSGQSTNHAFLKDGGEMGALTRAYNWSISSIGSVEDWPLALKTTVGIILHSDFPMFLWWGDDMIQFYNDAYRPSLGNNGKHPLALGQEAKECWPEIWDVIYPLIRQVKTSGKSFFAEDQLIPIYRNGALEDVYWTFSYSAVIGETGSIDGVLVVCTETTKKVQVFEEISRAQEKLLVSENNFKNIILQAPVAMGILKGPNHIVETANERMFELWGKSEQALLGKPVFDVLIDARREGFSALLDNVYKTGETYRAYGAPVTLPRKDTTGIVYVHFVYEAWRDNSGKIGGVMVVAVDVSEEVIARKKLEESENRVRAIVQSAPFPIGVYVGKEMRIALANQSILDVWGKGNDVIGKTYHEVLPELQGQEIYQQLDDVYATGIPFHARTQRVDLVIDGKLQSYYLNYSFTPLYDTAGNVYGVMNTAAELTDIIVAKQKVEQSEQNFRSMVKQAPVAMCILLGPEHVVEVANNLIIELWGKPEEEVLGKPIFVGLPDARDQGLEKLLNDVYHTGIAFHASEHPVTLLRKGKYETIYQNFVYEPYRDADGTILGVLAITIDVTEQVMARLKIEEVVRERTESLRQSNAELSQFAYITSHDLQEPARKISTFIDMLRNSLGEQIDQRSKSYLQKIESSASRMLALIRDVLAISQLSKTNIEFKPVDLNQVLEEIQNDFELLIEQKGCRIESDVLPMIEAVPVQMSQLFSNLVSNALKFMRPEAKICLTIRTGVLGKKEEKLMPNLDPSKQYYKFEFIDQGIGFSQINAEQIFNIFQRLHSKEEYQGTGIGLAMCRKIAENHGGHIFATSSPGKGATFTVILPAKQH